jgi:hypothetical protein
MIQKIQKGIVPGEAMMRRKDGQVQVPHIVGGYAGVLRRVRGVLSKCRRYIFWPFFAALLLVVGVSAARADAAGSVSVPGAGWVATGISVTAGDVLTITASGQWVEGVNTQGPDGQAAPWGDNFFNITDLGVCNVDSQGDASRSERHPFTAAP